MGKVLEAVSPTIAVRAIEESVLALYRYYGRSPLIELTERPDMVFLSSRLPSSSFNAVAGAWLEADQADAAIAATLRHFHAREVPALLWWVGPSSRPEDLGERLHRRAFSRVAHMPGMALDLVLPHDEPPSPPGLSIERVAGPEQLKAWAATVGEGFDMPRQGIADLQRLEASLGWEAGASWQRYLGLLQGEPAAASALLLFEGAAAIYNVAVRPAFRRRRLGAALTLEPLRQARARGLRLAVLQSTPVGEGLYRRLGFVEYCRMDQYTRLAP